MVINKIISGFLFLVVWGAVFFLPSTAAAAVGADEINLSQALIVNAPSDVASWPATTTITNVRLTPTVAINFDKRDGANRWPDYTPPGWDGPIEYTAWLFLKINNTWVGSGFIQAWNGREPITDASISDAPCNWYYSSRWAPMTDYRFKKGEQIGIMVTAGNARDSAPVASVKERSNIVIQSAPADASTSCPNTPPDPNPLPPPVRVPLFCNYPNALNFGGTLPCRYPPASCSDQGAVNFGGPLPCKYPPPPDCNPLPTDPDKLLACNYYNNNNFPQKTYKPGEDPSNPSTFPATGTQGIAAAYNSTDDSLLIVANNSVNNQTSIIGFMADPQTLQPRSAAFRIDSAHSGFRGTTKVAYSPDENKFLVVWEDNRPCLGNCRSAYGRLVLGSGVPEGNSDFAIHQETAFLTGVAYDSANKRFVVGYEKRSIKFRTVDLKGTVSASHMVVSSFHYQGQSGVTVNTALNEYWFAYAVATEGANPSLEDDRIMLSRVNAETLAVVGQPVQMSQTRLGHNNFGDARIAYSTKGNGAMVVWLERGRAGVGIWGRTMYDDGTLSAEYSVITPENNPYSEGYADPVINYNPWTDSFFVSTGDWSGNAWITEIDLGGLVFSHEPAIEASDATSFNWFDKLASLFISKASAAARGSFNITNALTRYGSVTLASRNYAAVVGTSYRSSKPPGSAFPPN